MSPVPLPEDTLYYYIPIYAWVYQVVSFPQVSPPKTCTHLSSPPQVLHSPPIHSCWFDCPNNIQWGAETMTLFIIPSCPPSRRLFYNLNIFLSAIWTGYRLDGPGIESRWKRDFPHLSRPALGPTQPPIQWVPGLSRGYRAAGAWRWPLTPF